MVALNNPSTTRLLMNIRFSMKTLPGVAISAAVGTFQIERHAPPAAPSKTTLQPSLIPPVLLLL